MMVLVAAKIKNYSILREVEKFYPHQKQVQVLLHSLQLIMHLMYLKLPQQEAILEEHLSLLRKDP